MYVYTAWNTKFFFSLQKLQISKTDNLSICNLRESQWYSSMLEDFFIQEEKKQTAGIICEFWKSDCCFSISKHQNFGGKQANSKSSAASESVDSKFAQEAHHSLRASLKLEMSIQHYVKSSYHPRPIMEDFLLWKSSKCS